MQSTSNPDIDYEAFAEWSNVFSSNNVYIEAEFDGQKVTECLRKIGRMTHSGIYIERNKIVFKRFDALGSVVANINEDNVKICEVTVDDAVVINKQFVYADYSVASDYFQITPFFADSESIAIYGLREQIEEDENVWYVNTASALDLAQRLVSVHADPYTQIDLQSVLYLLPYTLGDNMSTVSSFYGIEGSFRAMIDMEKALVTMEIDRSQVTQGFQLDVSTWDNLIEALV